MTLSLTSVRVNRPGWYRGDFHGHTTHSDGVFSPVEFAQAARAAGLDFVTVTDHNSLGSYENFPADPGLLVIPGIEVTLKEGDYNVFGLEGMQDWLERVCVGKLRFYVPLDGGRTTSEFMRRAAASGLLNSINHPLLKPWHWNDWQTDLRNLHCLEVWNDPSWPQNVDGNPQAVQLWTDLLNAGHRITAIGGSDFHRPEPGPKDPPKEAERLGLPSTYVYADELSGAGVLRAVRAGRVYVSMGPTATFEAQAGVSTLAIADDLGEWAGPITFRAEVRGADRPGVARIVKNGQVMQEAALSQGGAALEWQTDLPGNEPAWVRLEAWDEAGQLLVITNPIYTGPRLVPEQNFFGDFVADRE